MSWFVVLVILAITSILSLWYLSQRNKHFEKRGIVGPKPVPLFGNLLEARETGIFHEVIQKWTKRFGKIYGYFEGGTPVLVLSDLDMIQEILVKKFSVFHGRKLFPIQRDPDKDKRGHMFGTRGIRWKRLRSIVNPTFSASKMKFMASIMDEAIDVMMDVLDQKCRDGKAFDAMMGELNQNCRDGKAFDRILDVLKEKCPDGKAFDIYRIYQAMTMDTIGRCAFGFVSNCQRDPNDRFLVLCRETLQSTVGLNWKSLCANEVFYNLPSVLLPEFRPFWNELAFLADKLGQSHAWARLGHLIRPILEHRRQGGQPVKADLLQLLLEAQTDDLKLGSNVDFSASDSGTDESEDLIEDPDVQKGWKLEKKLMLEEIIQQSLLFLVAGFETTSTTLAYATHLLAVNPDSQRKLVAEVDAHFPNDKVKPTYDSVAQLPYMQMVLQETLRLYPLAAIMENRMCMKSCTIGDNGLKIPGGSVVQADVWSIHYDSEIWGPSPPEDFVPERFQPEVHSQRHPMCWLPFGAGPRNCIGQRFAMLEMKLALVRILQKYEFVRAPETQVPLKLREGATTTPCDGVFVKLSERKR